MISISAEPETTTAKKSVAYAEPEKVQTLDPKIAKAHTTFYNNKKTALMTISAEPESKEASTKKSAAYAEPEKVQTLDPKIAKAHTTFYNNKKQALMSIEGIPLKESNETFTGVKNFPYPGPEQVHTLDPKLQSGHLTTFYNKKWNED